MDCILIISWHALTTQFKNLWLYIGEGVTTATTTLFKDKKNREWLKKLLTRFKDQTTATTISNFNDWHHFVTPLSFIRNLVFQTNKLRIVHFHGKHGKSQSWLTNRGYYHLFLFRLFFFFGFGRHSGLLGAGGKVAADLFSLLSLYACLRTKIRIIYYLMDVLPIRQIIKIAMDKTNHQPRRLLSCLKLF